MKRFGILRHQPVFDFARVFPGRQTGAVADPENMRVDRHGGLAKRHIQNHIGGFAPHTRQGLQRRARMRHLAAMIAHQLF